MDVKYLFYLTNHLATTWVSDMDILTSLEQDFPPEVWPAVRIAVGNIQHAVEAIRPAVEALDRMSNTERPTPPTLRLIKSGKKELES